MTQQDEYFEWMYRQVCLDNPSYRQLLRYLHSVPFRSPIPMDENRVGDGERLRYKFAYELGCDPPPDICEKRCSVLEMMVALCKRCEEQIMYDPAYGLRTEHWFLSMINTLGLAGMSDGYFNAAVAEAIVKRFLDRRYEPNGIGGLFYISHPPKDMRYAEIWSQMCWFLNTLE